MISTQQAQASFVIIKAHLQDEIRKFQLVKDEQQFSFSSLLDKLMTVFSLSSKALKISYVDSEKDSIQVSSDEELNAAILDKNTPSTELLTLAIFLNVAKVEKKREKKEKKSSSESSDEEKITKKRKYQKFKASDSSDSSEEESKQKKSKEERKAVKEAAKLLRKEMREKSKLAKKEQNKDTIDLTEAQVWPSSIRYVHLDGNNMMFLNSTLRSLLLNKKQKSCERLLTAAVKVFTTLTKAETTLWFDSTSQISYENPSAKVVSAAPLHKTTDDAMIALVSAAKPEELKQSVFITSDRALREQLKAKGTNVMKPKKFLEFVFHHANVGKKYEDCNTWMKAELLPLV